MAFDEKASIVSLPVSTDLHTKQFQFVTVNSSGQLAITGDGLAADGVLLSNDATTQGRNTTVAIAGIVRVAAGGTITAGDYLMVSSGKAITQTSTNKIVAKALANAVSGDNVAALLILQR